MRRFAVAILGLIVAGSAALSTTAAAFSAGAAPACRASQLGVWVAISQGKAALGSAFYPLEFTNLSGHACSLYGYPGVSALSRTGAQLGSPASHYPDGTPRTVLIGAGGTAHALFIWSDAAVYTAPRCGPTSDVQLLRVYPPGQRSATDALFSLEACSRPGVTYLSVGPIKPGV
jgi:Protein of unknown function (DUF4232)